MPSHLRTFIRLAVEAVIARVPQQLVEPDGERTDDDDREDVKEFSGVGAIVGYGAPLGVDPDKLGRKKNSSGKK